MHIHLHIYTYILAQASYSQDGSAHTLACVFLLPWRKHRHLRSLCVTYFCEGLVVVENLGFTTLSGLLLIMPGKRSVYTADLKTITQSQQRRLDRDAWYSTAHSRANRTFVEVDRELASTVKIFAKAKATHIARERRTGQSAHFARHASL